MGEEVNGDIPAEGTPLYPMRYSENNVAGSRETIEDDTILPESRVKAIPEVGTASSAGDMRTKWNVDEQDKLFAAVMCNDWHTEVLTEADVAEGILSRKTLTLGDVRKQFFMVKKYPQTPASYKLYEDLQVNQLQLNFALKALVECTWSWMGGNSPDEVTTDPVPQCVVQDALTTKAFKTLAGSIYTGKTLETLAQNRQLSAFDVTINNNMEATNALYEVEAVEQSLGDFQVTGNFTVLNSGQKAIDLFNDANNGEELYIKNTVYREYDTEVQGVPKKHRTEYELLLHVHLDSTSESKDGNKLNFSVAFTMGDVNGIKFTKTVKDITEGGAVDAQTPVFSGTLADVSYETTDTPSALDGTATVSDGGTVTYQWYADDVAIEGATSATYTPDVSSEGVVVYKVVATNTNASATGSTTATAEQSCTVTVAD